MWKRTLVLLFLLVFRYQCVNKLDYEKELNWGKTCEKGPNQSPINLPRNRAFYIYAVNTYIDSVNYKNFISSSLKYVNGLIKFDVPPNSYMILYFQGFVYKYDLYDIFIHVNSEHTFDLKYSNIEIQFVHKKDVLHFSLYNKSKGDPNVHKYMITSFLYNLGEENSFIQSLNFNTGKPNNANLNSILSPSLSNFYLYEGSFTYPSCSENVLWMIINEVKSISETQLSLIKGIIGSNYGTKSNSRRVKPLNSRYIYISEYSNFLISGKIISNTNNISLPVNIILILVLILLF
jgi:carbonic anhydrase